MYGYYAKHVIITNRMRPEPITSDETSYGKNTWRHNWPKKKEYDQNTETVRTYMGL